MCCHVSNKTAYAEEVQVGAESMQPENNATNAKHDDKVSPTPGQVEGVEKKGRSPSYFPSPAASEDEGKLLEKPPKKPFKDTAEKSLTKAGTNTVQPVEKKDGSPSQSPSPQKSQKVDKTVKKHGYIVVDPPEKSPKEDIANTVPYDWYKLHEDKDKNLQFKDMVNHASSLTLT